MEDAVDLALSPSMYMQERMNEDSSQPRQSDIKNGTEGVLFYFMQTRLLLPPF
jgi:hypothetical protein